MSSNVQRQSTAVAIRASRRTLALVAIVLCLAGAAVAYVTLSRGPAPTAEETSATQRADAVQRAMDQAAPAAPATPEPERSPRRGAIPAAGTN